MLMLLSFTAAFAAESELKKTTSWKISANSAISWAGIEKAFDNDNATYWHTDYKAEGSTVTSKDEYPFIITVDFGKTEKVSGWYYQPRLGNGTGSILAYNIYSSTDGSKFTQIYSGTFDYPAEVNDERPASTASWGNKDMRAIKIEVTSALGDYGSAAEIAFLTGGTGKTNGSGAEIREEAKKTTTTTTAASTKTESTAKGDVKISGTVIPTEATWKYEASSDVATTIAKAFDGDNATYWHTNYTSEGGTVTGHDECPHIVTVDFGKKIKVSGWYYQPRLGNGSGTILDYKIYASDDGKAFKEIYTGKFEYEAKPDDNRAASTASWGDVEMRAIKIEVVSSIGGYGTAAEINFLTGGTGETNGSGAELAEQAKLRDVLTFLTKDGWSITATSQKDWGAPEKMIDGNLKNTWHTDYTSEGGTVTSHDEAPFTIELTLPKAEKTTGLLYTPRQDSGTGRWLEAEVYVSADGKDKGEKVGTVKGEQGSADDILLQFGKELTAKQVTIIITKSVGSYGSCAELELVTGEIKLPEKELAKDFDDAFNMVDWEISVSSNVSWAPIAKAFDGDTKTYWHSDYTSENGTVTGHDLPPFTIDITLPATKKISGFELYARETAESTGRVKGYELWAAETDDSEFIKVAGGELSGSVKDDIDFVIAFEAKKLKFIVTDGGGGYAVISELVFKKAPDDAEVYPLAEFMETMDEVTLKEIDKTGFKAENDLGYWGGDASYVFDGAAAFWQTEEVVGEEPVILKIDLGKEYTFSAVSIYPRQSTDFHGFWEEFNMWAGSDQANLEEVLHDYSYEKSLDRKMIYFDEPVTARYVEFEITKYAAKRVSCGEISFWQTKEQRDAAGGTGKFVMQIGSNEIQITKGKETYTKTLDTAPYITSAGRTLIPLRGLLEEMGAEIEWVDKSQSINIMYGSTGLLLQIRNNLVWADTANYGMVMYTLESAPRIKDSRTFVPLRFLSEQFGYTVTWDGETQTITIEK